MKRMQRPKRGEAVEGRKCEDNKNKKNKKKVEAGVGREFKEKTRFELATASRESAKMKQSVQLVRMEEDLNCSTSREVLHLSKQAYNQFYARTKAAQNRQSASRRVLRALFYARTKAGETDNQRAEAVGTQKQYCQSKQPPSLPCIISQNKINQGALG